jgi:hypothetical protein
MDAAYDGKERSIRRLVSKVVPTYHPAGVHGSEEKGEAFEEQMKEVEQSEAENQERIEA